MLKKLHSRVSTWPLFLLLATIALPAADWTKVELDLPPGQHQVIDLTVSDRGIEILTSQNNQVKDQSGMIEVPQFTRSLVSLDGTRTTLPWDPAKSLPTDAVPTPSARSHLRLAGFTKTGVAGRASQTVRGGPGMLRAFVSTPQERIWLPKPSVQSFEAPGAGLGVGLSQPVCVNAAGWIAGEWVLNFTGGSTTLPVVWVPDDIGGYQTAPLLTTKADYTRYQNLKILDMTGWMVGYYGSDEKPTPLIVTPRDGVAQVPPAFDVHNLALSPDGGGPAFDFGVATRISNEQAMGWVARKGKPTETIPAIWHLSPSFGAFESTLRTLEGTGSVAAIVGGHIYIHATGQVMLLRDGKMEPLTIDSSTYSALAKVRGGIAIARVHSSDRLAVIRLSGTGSTP